MTETQTRLLQLFKEIVDICHEHNIVYYMAGGTLIGVVRHKGFIPWDDDLDIMMTRDEWNKFVEVCKDSLPENRTLECQELSRDYPNTFGRYTDISSSAIHVNEVLGDGHAGYVIDILVLDPIPDLSAHKQYSEDFMLYSDLINPTINYSYRFCINRERYVECLERIKREGKDTVLSELEQRMFSYPESECDYYVLRWGGVTFLFDKEMYGCSRWGEFEGVKCRIPDKTSDYLVQHFGDEWETIPPHDEQESHNAVFDLDVDYKTIQNDYLPLLNVSDIRDKWIKRKLFYFSQMEERFQYEQNLAKAKAELCRMETEIILSTNGELLAKAIHTGDYKSAEALFEGYFQTQCAREIIGREDFAGMQRFVDPAFVDIGDQNLYYALLVLINTDRISKAKRILDIRDMNSGSLIEQLMEIKRFIETYRKIISGYDLQERHESILAAEQLLLEYPRNISLLRFLARAYIQEERYEKAEIIIDRGLKECPEDGYFLKYLGDYYLLHKREEEKAEEFYKKAMRLTNNGIVQLEIRERQSI